MQLLTTELILIVNFLALLSVYLIKFNYNRFLKYIVIIALIVILPILFKYLYTFDILYNQILFLFGIFIISIFLYKILKRIHPLILFIISFFYIIYFSILIIVKGSIPIWTIETNKKVNLIDNYYYEYYNYKDLKKSYPRNYEIMYKYVFFDVLKKQVIEKDFKVSKKCENYYFLSDGVILKLDSLENYKIIEKIPKDVKFYNENEVLENCLFLRNKKDKK